MSLLNSFLCCFELETGGLVIGWLGSVLTGVSIVASAIAIVYTLTVCAQNGTCLEVSAGGIFLLATLLGLFAIFRSVVTGTKEKNDRKFLPSLIMFGVFIFFSAVGLISSIITLELKGIGGSLFLFIFNGYIFIIMRSLYLRFKSQGCALP